MILDYKSNLITLALIVSVGRAVEAEDLRSHSCSLVSHGNQTFLWRDILELSLFSICVCTPSLLPQPIHCQVLSVLPLKYYSTPPASLYSPLSPPGSASITFSFIIVSEVVSLPLNMGSIHTWALLKMQIWLQHPTFLLPWSPAPWHSPGSAAFPGLSPPLRQPSHTAWDQHIHCVSSLPHMMPLGITSEGPLTALLCPIPDYPQRRVYGF